MIILNEGYSIDIRGSYLRSEYPLPLTSLSAAIYYWPVLAMDGVDYIEVASNKLNYSDGNISFINTSCKDPEIVEMEGLRLVSPFKAVFDAFTVYRDAHRNAQLVFDIKYYGRENEFEELRDYCHYWGMPKEVWQREVSVLDEDFNPYR